MSHTCGGPDSACDADCMTPDLPDDAPFCACDCGCIAAVHVAGDRCPMCSEACAP